jgi:hypothetical protein
MTRVCPLLVKVLDHPIQRFEGIGEVIEGLHDL